MRRLTCLFLALLLLVSMTACGGSAAPTPTTSDPEEKAVPVEEKSQTDDSSAEKSDESAQPEEVSEPEPAPEPEPVPEPAPYAIYDPTVMPEGGTRDGVTYTATVAPNEEYVLCDSALVLSRRVPFCG